MYRRAYVLMVGTALLMGGLAVLASQILDKRLGLPPEVLTMLFGLGVMQVLLVQPRGVVEDLRRLGLLIGSRLGLVRRAPLAATGELAG